MRLLPSLLLPDQQRQLVAELRLILDRAPLYSPAMPGSGNPLPVRMSNCGPLGWLSEIGGYRYAGTHPETGAPWPAIPAMVDQPGPKRSARSNSSRTN